MSDNRGRGGNQHNNQDDPTLDDLLNEVDSGGQSEGERVRRQRKRRADKERHADTAKNEQSREERKNKQQAQYSQLYKLEEDIKKANEYEDILKINLSNYSIPPEKRNRIQRLYEGKKRELEVKKYEKELDEAKAKQAPAEAASKALPIFLQPVAKMFLNMGTSKESKNLDKAKKKKAKTRRKYLFNISSGVGIVLVAMVLSMFAVAVAGGSIASILLSHPEAIRELYENNMLGDALYMGNVTEDVVLDGEVVVKGNPAARPGCFIYNGVWYCGNCNVVNLGDGDKEDKTCSVSYGTAGQGGITDDAKKWAKDYNATFIGDSLGVGVKPTLSKLFSNMNFDVKGSRWLIYNGDAESTDSLNGIHILKELAKNNDIKDTLVIALGTNGGIKEGELEAYMNEVPSNVKKTIFVNTSSEGGVDSEAIDKAIKDFVGTSGDEVGYLDWKKYAEKAGRDTLYDSDDIHMTGSGYEEYGEFITQGLYEIFNVECSTGDLGDHNVSGKFDADTTRSDVSIYKSEGIQAWPRKIMNLGTNFFLDINEISGYRGGDGGDHGQGLAIDFMVPVGSHDKKDELGDVVAQWVVDNMEAMNVDYVIWEQRIYGSWNKKWQLMEDRFSITQNHFDHPHVSFNPGEGDLDAIKLPSKGMIELPDVVEARGEGTGDHGLHTEHDHEQDYGVPVADIDTSPFGDTDVLEIHDLYNLSEEEYKILEEEKAAKKLLEVQELIVARGSKSPGAYDTSGWESKRDKLYNFNVRSKEPEWVDVDFLKELFEEKYPNSRIKGHEEELFDLADQYGINVAVMLGQIFLETSMGSVGCPAGEPHNPASYESKFNFGCVMWPGSMSSGSGRKQSDFESNWMVDLGVNMNDRGYVADRYWADPPTVALGLELGFRVYDNLATNTNTYKEVLDLYSPIGDGGQTHDKFMSAMYGVLQQFHIDIEATYDEKVPGGGSNRKSSNKSDNETFTCPDNCEVTEEEKEVGTANFRALEKGKTWENDNILLTDLGYMSDTVTPENLDKFIDEIGPSGNKNGFKGLGKDFYDAGIKSGYDPRYLLAHAIHETSWGTTTDWTKYNNAYKIREYDTDGKDSLMEYDSPSSGLSEAAMTIYKNYYVTNKQLNLQDMYKDPEPMREHNYSTDSDWHINIGAYMTAMDEFMGPSEGGSVTGGSNNSGPSTTESGEDLGHSCTLGDVTFNNLPYPPSEMVISSFFQDDNYPSEKVHNGMDMTYTHGGEGPIYSVDEGEVIKIVGTCEDGNAACGGGWGNHIQIKHPGVGDGEYSTQYAHIKNGSLLVDVGDKVTAGQQIATMGNTGNSMGIHLHFELWHGSTRVDMFPHFAWKDATYAPGWDNYLGPHTGDVCTPGAGSKSQQGSNNMAKECPIGGDKPKRSGSLKGDTEAEQVYHFFSELGFSDAAVAGIMGNLKHESGLHAKMIQSRQGDEPWNMTDEEMDKLLAHSIYIWSDSEIDGDNIGPAVGISQWEHDHHDNGFSGRWEGVMAWSKKNGYSHWDLEAQLEYIAREMGEIEDKEVPIEGAISMINNANWACNSDEGCVVGIQGFDNFKKTDDIRGAVRTYFQFNRAGTAATAQRYAYAEEYYAEMANWK